MKKNKNQLKKDSVNSETFHVGIELELVAPCEGDDSHDDDACRDSREEDMRNHLETMSNVEILVDYVGIERSAARSVDSYFDAGQWVNDYMNDWYDEGCDDSDCSYNSVSGKDVRENIQEDLKDLTGNTSIKVVEDGSIKHKSDETDAEVCWNYFASRDTLNDNKLILAHLAKNNLYFNKSCGLHINLNNYLKLDAKQALPISALSFLFSFVGKSRENSTYCNSYAISDETKYSMIFEQGDRVEFRFFSPTLDPEKLHNYVVLANTVYKRLAGKKAFLPKKTMSYFYDKMIKTNGRSIQEAQQAIKSVNSLKSYNELAGIVVETQLELVNNAA